MGRYDDDGEVQYQEGPEVGYAKIFKSKEKEYEQFALHGNEDLLMNENLMMYKKKLKYTLSSDANDKVILETGEKPIVLVRIVALKDIYSPDGRVLVKKGQKGGFVDGEDVLSQKGRCWIYDDAVAIRSEIKGNAVVAGKAVVLNSVVKGNAVVTDLSRVSDNSVITQHAVVKDMAKVIKGSIIGGNAEIGGKTKVVNKIIVEKPFDKPWF